MKKIFLGLGLLFAVTFAAHSQGVENIIVERYYVANAADAADANGSVAEGAITYRIYVDLAAGYNLQAVYGDPSHDLVFTTTTTFFNNEDRGNYIPTYSTSQAANNTVMLDSWLSLGGAASGQVGVPKTVDSDGSIGNNDGLLANNDPYAGIPLSTADGMIAGSPAAVSFSPGFDATVDAIFGATSNAGNSLVVNGDAYFNATGATGPDAATNIVLIGQFTTDGTFNFELNLQVGTPSAGVENWVATNASGAELTLPALSGTFAPNVAPTCVLTAPLDGATANTGDVVNLTATADDILGVGGSVTQVEFFEGSNSLGVDNTAPYEATFSSMTEGTFAITAVATDNEGATTTSTTANVTISNPAPVVAITAPADGTNYTIGDVATIDATATDDGSIAQVEFFDGATSLGVDISAPYSVNYSLSTSGTKNIYAIATDEEGKTTTSAPISIVVPSTVSYAIFTDSMQCYQGNSFEIPVMRTNALANVYGFDIEISYEKSAVAPTGYVSVNDDMINHLYVNTTTDIKATEGKISVSVYLNGLGGASLFNVAAGDSAQVVSVEFERLPDFELGDSILFSATVVESYNTYTVLSSVDPGYFKVTGTNSVDGNLKYWSNDEAIVYNGSNLITDITTTGGTVINPDTNGEFTYDFSNGDSIAVTRDIDTDTDVMPIINGFDALLTAKVTVDDPTFTPNVYQVIAMDVNMDGVISAGDVSQIFQRTTGTISEFEQTSGAGTDWTFVSENAVLNDAEYQISTTYPLPDGQGYAKSMIPAVGDYISLKNGECADPELTIVGIMIGDVNGSYKNLSPSHPDYNLLKSETASTEAVIFDFENAVEEDGIVELPVYINTDFAINSLDFAVEYNTLNLNFLDIVNPVEGLKLLVNNNVESGKVLFSSYKESEIANNVAVITVRFETVASATKSDIVSTTAYLNGEFVQSTVKENVTIVPSDSEQIEATIFPNPVDAELNVVVTQPSNISILNNAGQILFVKANVPANVVVTFNVEELPTGSYYVEVSNDNSQTTETFVKK